MWLPGLLLFCAALFFVWFPVIGYKRQQSSGVSQQALNIQAFKTQIAELETEKRSGRLTPADFDEIKAELERNLLGDVSTDSPVSGEVDKPSKPLPLVMGIMLSVFVVFVGSGLYLELGRSDDLQKMESGLQLAAQMQAASPDQRLMILQDAANSNPDNPDAWYALARSYASINNFEDAGTAYERVLSLTEHPEVMSEYAQMLFFAHNNRITAKVKALADRSVQIRPDNETGLGLLGIDAFNHQQYNQAADYWQRALDSNPDGSGADALRAGIAQAQLRAQDGPLSNAVDDRSPETQTPTAVHAGKVSFTVNVSLDEALRSRVTPENYVFVLAKAVQGPPMPLAVSRIQVKDLPARIVLDDSMAMTPQLTISSFQEVQLIARVSLSGTPAASPGDLQGSKSPVSTKNGPSNIKISIDKVVE